MCARSSTWLFKDSERNDRIHVSLSIYFKVATTTILSVAVLVSLTRNYQNQNISLEHTHNANVHISSVQDGIYALGKGPYALRPFSHKFSQRCIRNSSSVSLMMSLSGPFREDYLALLHSGLLWHDVVARR